MLYNHHLTFQVEEKGRVKTVETILTLGKKELTEKDYNDCKQCALNYATGKGKAFLISYLMTLKS